MRPPLPVPAAGWVFAAALLLQLPLALNPGYFSHDELQWAAFAEAGTRVSWLDIAIFQYRPLTFNLWMALSRVLFDAPMLFHSVLVAWGSLHAALLCKPGTGCSPPTPALIHAKRHRLRRHSGRASLMCGPGACAHTR